MLRKGSITLNSVSINNLARYRRKKKWKERWSDWGEERGGQEGATGRGFGNIIGKGYKRTKSRVIWHSGIRRSSKEGLVATQCRSERDDQMNIAGGGFSKWIDDIELG